MDPKILSALIAAIVSLIVGVIGFISTALSNRNQQRELERKIQSQFTDQLYSLRLQHYATAFDITDQIQHRPEPKRIDDRKVLIKIRDELVNWKTGQVSLIISHHSLNEFYELRNALSMGYGENQRFSIEQAEKIFKTRNAFRSALRKDIGLLYGEDTDLK